MKHFSLDALRERLLGAGGYEFFLSDSLDEARAANGLGSSGHAFINQAVGCVFVGLLSPAEQLFTKARDWIREAISTSESPSPYFPHGTEAIWFSDLATAEWYLGGEEDHSLLNKCVDYQLEYLRMGAGNDPASMPLVAVDFLLASRCGDMITWVPGSMRTQDSGCLGTELAMALRWCNPGKQDSMESLRAFLVNNTRRWLERGHYQRPVKWMRLLKERDLPPAETVKEVLNYI